jgi:hypothetical protein
MSKERCVHKLRRYALLSQFASILVIIVGGINLVLFISPTLVGVRPESASAYQGQWIWLIFGIIFVLVGVFFSRVAFHWPRVLLRILKTQPYCTMRVQLKKKEDRESTQYYAYLTDVSTVGEASTWRIGLWGVHSEIEGWLDRVCSAKVYRDPKTGDPTVVELEDMYLWAIKGEVKRI